jgi:DtxR family transcriptional regulator, manganese transport regulator
MSERQGESEPFRRTRRDHASETAQDYVEAIAEITAAHGVCRITDLARKFGVSHVTVTRIISRLKGEGWVDSEPYRPVQLTPRGRRLAEESQQRHEVVYRFLLALGVDAKTAAVDAEGIEHHVSQATLQRFQSFLEEGGEATPLHAHPSRSRKD